MKMANWQRGDWFDSSSLLWVNPSPNMRSLNQALLYPGIAMLEAAQNYSVGRGTDAPFEQVGADWIRGRELATYLNSRFIPGVRVYPTRFRPLTSHFSGTEVEGVRFVVTSREAFDSVRLGLEVAAALEHLYPGRIEWEKCKWLIGNRSVMDALKNGMDPERIDSEMTDSIRGFLERRKPYLLYQ